MIPWLWLAGALLLILGVTAGMVYVLHRWLTR